MPEIEVQFYEMLFQNYWKSLELNMDGLFSDREISVEIIKDPLKYAPRTQAQDRTSLAEFTNYEWTYGNDKFPHLTFYSEMRWSLNATIADAAIFTITPRSFTWPALRTSFRPYTFGEN